MSGQRKPKRLHPKRMCYQCREWERTGLDWGECWLIANYTPGDQYETTYAYSDCVFKVEQWREKAEP